VSRNPSLFDRIDFAAENDPIAGEVTWSPVKSLWWSGMAAGWVVFGTLYFSWVALGIFFVSCGIILCLGHSLGMHRKLIHDAYDCPDWVEKLFVYLGTLVGLGGPFTMMYTHDLRDWAQRQSACHDYLSQQRDIVTDFWWQLHCRFRLYDPPDFRFPEKLVASRYYKFLQVTSMAQQIPVAMTLFAFGDLGWVAWGICGRVTVSMFGHWIIGYFAHNSGHRDWQVEGAAVQGYNVRWFGLVTFGECWHNNHHAFPGSAKLGLYPDQFDPGWLVLLALERLGLASNLMQPDDLAARSELLRIDSGNPRSFPRLARP
jgi:stearoyl-CoA desaturase (delta-9 desaturase)